MANSQHRNTISSYQNPLKAEVDRVRLWHGGKQEMDRVEKEETSST